MIDALNSFREDSQDTENSSEYVKELSKHTDKIELIGIKHIDYLNERAKEEAAKNKGSVSDGEKKKKRPAKKGKDGSAAKKKQKKRRRK